MRLSATAKRLFPDFNTRLLLRRFCTCHKTCGTLLSGGAMNLPLPEDSGLSAVVIFVNREQSLDYFIRFGKLEPDDRVLDVGCGIGRMAVPLTRYLSKAGSYEGFDIVPKGIEWCSKHITPRYPNFKFSVADIYSKHYNPQGRLHAVDYKFPYPDSSFDFVLLTSVFTHMLPDAVKNYVAEISRVLKLGGRCLFTGFLLNEESLHLIASEKSTLQFKDGPQHSCMVVDPAFPEAAVAFTEEFITDSLDHAALTMDDPPAFGSWCGRAEGIDYPDIVVARRR